MSLANTPVASPRPRPFYWSVRRELWEHRAAYLAPVVAAGVVLFGFLLSTFRLPAAVRAAAAVADPKTADRFMMPYNIAALAVIVIMSLVALFYGLAALHGERQDRSIQFWKSLPVSDLTTVLAKFAVPAVVMPLIAVVVAMAAQLVILLVSTVVVLLNGIDPTLLWKHVDLSLMWVVLPYGLLVNALWQAPVYAWLLLVSGWAKRMAFVWAVAPLLGLCLVEKLAFNSTRLVQLLIDRLLGGFGEAFSIGGKGEDPVGSFADLDPGRILGNPNIWIGLAFAAVFLFAAVRLRRSRDPI